MGFDIRPNDRYLQEQRTYYRVNVPKDEITDEMVAKRVKHDNLSAGDDIVIQCFNHEKTVLLHEGEYRVVRREERMARQENERGDIRQFLATDVEVECIGWWASRFAENPLKRSWNPGLKRHQVKRGDEVLFEHEDKNVADRYIKDAA